MVELRLARNEVFLHLDSAGSDNPRGRLGSVASIHASLQAGPLTASKLEAAIAEIEDLIMPALRNLGPGTRLRVAGAVLQGVLGKIEGEGNVIALSGVEDLFNRVADLASGGPSSRWPAATHPDFVLGLVLLREVMHHGGFVAVSAH